MPLYIHTDCLMVWLCLLVCWVILTFPPSDRYSSITEYHSRFSRGWMICQWWLSICRFVDSRFSRHRLVSQCEWAELPPGPPSPPGRRWASGKVRGGDLDTNDYSAAGITGRGVVLLSKLTDSIHHLDAKHWLPHYSFSDTTLIGF